MKYRIMFETSATMTAEEIIEAGSEEEAETKAEEIWHAVHGEECTSEAEEIASKLWFTTASVDVKDTEIVAIVPVRES